MVICWHNHKSYFLRINGFKEYKQINEQRIGGQARDLGLVCQMRTFGTEKGVSGWEKGTLRKVEA